MYVCNEENENNGARARKQLLWARVVVVVTYVYTMEEGTVDG